MIGQVIGNHRIVAELGQGGMGVVYRAEHVQLGRAAAIKVLRPQMSGDPQIVQRFFNEARAASSIDHPGIVEIYDFGQDAGGRAYIVMPLLRGESLDHRLMRPLPPLEAASLIAQVAGALAAAHARGIVHRDLKPDNIYLVPNELLPGGVQVKLLDFGIAKLADEGAAGFRTQTGILIGTPAYMSPEQCMGRADLDHRTDLYSVGCILFHMLCGRPPFMSDQGTGVMIAMHLRDPVPDPRSLAPHVPEPLVAITLRLLEKDPAARFQSAQELRQALVAAGAIAPVTNPNAHLDPYGPTVASLTGPTLPLGGAPAAAPGGAPTAALGGAPTAALGGAPTAALGGAPTAIAGGAGRMPAAGGPYAGAAPTGITTHGGAASQQIERPKRGGRGAWIAAVALLLAGGGAVAAVALSGGDDDGGDDEVAEVPAPPGGSGSAPGEVRPAGQPQPQPLASGTVEAPCPQGQFRSEDTRGQCCWAGQAWSSAKHRCIGAPTCPPGMEASGEQCIVVLAEVEPVKPSPPGSPPPPPPLPPLAPAPAIRLNASLFAPGAPIEIRFAQPIRSTPARRAWVTVSAAGSASTSYGAWKYVDDGVRTASLAAPSKPGAYEVRLHTDYPAKAYNVERAVPFTVAPPAEVPDVPGSRANVTPPSGQRFTLAAHVLRGGDKAEVRFPAPLRPVPGEQFWITVIEAGAPDDRWGTWAYVPNGARTMSLPVPAQAGVYEVRLHANYPKQSTNVVHRARLRVEAP